MTPTLTATALLADLRQGRTTAVAAVETTLARIAARNPDLNAIVTVDAEGALAAAHAVDAARRRGVAVGPLAGLPVGIKDVIDVAALPSTGGDPARATHRAPRDAPAVARLRAAGAIPVAKSNVPLNAADYQTFNELFGPTRNPWDLARTPGGSSGGAAAAVAAGLVPVELGTDLAGSLRLPAAYCGVASLKPSHGLVPAGGVYAGVGDQRDPGDLLVVGPLARCVADLELLLAVLAPAAGPAAPPAGWQPRLTLWLDEPFCPPEPAVAALMRAVVAALPGAAPVRESRAPWDAAEFFATHCALMYGALALAAPADTFDYFVRRSAGLDGLPDPVARPTELLAAGLTLRHRDWLAANERRWGFAARLAEVFADADAIICPAAPSPAPLLAGERLDRRRQGLGGRDQPALLQTYWAAIASSLHLPAVTVPVGVDPAGLPVAVQVIAPQGHDRQALAVAARIEQAVGGGRWPPGYG